VKVTYGEDAIRLGSWLAVGRCSVRISARIWVILRFVHFLSSSRQMLKLSTHSTLCSILNASYIFLHVAYVLSSSCGWQSTNSSGYRASLWDPWPYFILLFFFRLTVTWFFFLRHLLWRENGSVVYYILFYIFYFIIFIYLLFYILFYFTIFYRLIWDCVPFLSPLTKLRDYGGSILTRLHTGITGISHQTPVLYA
jgi:hypothetical protein